MTIELQERDFGLDGVERVRERLVALLERKDLTELECRDALRIAHKVMGALRAAVLTRAAVREGSLHTAVRESDVPLGDFVCNAIELPRGYDGPVDLLLDERLIVLADRIDGLSFRFVRVPFLISQHHSRVKVVPEEAVLLGYEVSCELHYPHNWRRL